MLFVFASAVSMLVLTWAVVVGPGIRGALRPVADAVVHVHALDLAGAFLRYASAAAVIAAQLLAFHLVARRAGAAHSATSGPACCCRPRCGSLVAGLYSYYLNFSDYTRFYAGLSQLMVAMIFFQMTAVIVILGAELNRGIMEFKRMNSGARPRRRPRAAPRPLGCAS